jgi:hypothetical protein
LTAWKNANKKSRKSNGARKNISQQQKNWFSAEKYILDAAGKNDTAAGSEAGKKPSEAGKKLQQRKPSFAAEKVAATEKIHFRSGKKQQPWGTTQER